jgi:hypothetical protein
MDFKHTRATLAQFSAMEKTAIDWAKGLKIGLLAGGMATTGALAAKGIEYGETKLKAKHYFKKMLASNPDLRKRKQSIKPFFRSLMHFSPDVAGDPLAAGSFIRRMHDFKEVGLPLQDVESLSRIRSAQGRGGISDALRESTRKITSFKA